MMRPGHVTLVGAGPGDPELMTVKAVRVLREADVVLHDDLVPPAILALVPPHVRRVPVGKRGGCRSTPQSFIEQLMIREARAGARVVRLKGGDPFIFGRGGEEMASLHAAGIAVDVVPGITSGLAAPTSVGIPVTHRAMAHGVALVTGHAGEDSAEEPDWEALVRSRLTLVIYMGMSRAQALRDALLAAGMPARTPVAVIADATRPEQRMALGTLQSFVEDAAAASLASPAIIVVGEVAGLATEERLDQAGWRKLAGADAHT